MIKSGTIQLPAYDPMTGNAGTWPLSAGTTGGTYLSRDIPYLQWAGAGQPFTSPPTVVVSLAGIDETAGVSNVRLSVENVQAEEFNIRVTTGAGCTLNQLWVTWVAHDGA